MRNPTVTAVPARAAAQEIGAMALMPGIVLPARALGKLWSLLDRGDQDGVGCANVEELRKAAEKQKNKDGSSTSDFDWLGE